jgi:poly(A) polymerase
VEDGASVITVDHHAESDGAGVSGRADHSMRNRCVFRHTSRWLRRRLNGRLNGRLTGRLDGRPKRRRTWRPDLASERGLSGIPEVSLAANHRLHDTPKRSAWIVNPPIVVGVMSVPPRFQVLLDETAHLGAAFGAAGFRLYLVGGIVRDTLLGRVRDELDLDFTTNATPEDTLAILRTLPTQGLWTQGQRFGTIGAKLGDRVVEITTHRGEAYHPDSRKPDVVFAKDIEADLSRRDFTVNAIALEITKQASGAALIDPFNGAADLVAGVLRTPLDPHISFSDDPLRMLRAARFIAGYGLQPEPALLSAVEALASRLTIVSAERIRQELDKLMVVEAPASGLWFLVQSGLCAHFLPELPAMELEQDPIHRHKDVLAHTIAVVGNTSPDKVLRLAALFHDIAKPKTRRIGAHGVSFHHHDVVGARMTRDRMRALTYSNQDIDDVAMLVELHLRFHTYQAGWTDSAVRRYVKDAGHLLDRLNELTRCDCTTRNPRKAAALAKRMDELEARIAELRAQETLDALRPDLDGKQIMQLLGIGPSRVIGEALDMLLTARLDEGPLGEEEATKRLFEWWAQRQQ